jgi:hypothetical protein
MEKFTVSVGCTGAHNHSGILGQGPASWPTLAAFSQPTMHGARPERMQHSLDTWSPRPSAPSACGATWNSMARCGVHGTTASY